MERGEFISQQKNIAEMRTRSIKEKVGCEAKEHNPSCPCLVCQKPQEDCGKCPSLTKQHVVPRCIAKNILGWSENQIDDPSNKERLSRPCHDDADRHVARHYKELTKNFDKNNKPAISDVLSFRKLSSQ